jgi:hypothetical protein
MSNNNFFDIESEIDEFNNSTSKTDLFAQLSKRLAEKNQEALDTLEKMEHLEFQLSQLKDRHRFITEEEMPSIMDELGVSSVTLSSGKKVSLDSSVHASIAAANREAAHSWLREHELGDIIKNEVVVKFSRSQDNMVAEITSTAENLGLHYDRKESVHPQTLKALVKEQMSQGTQLPPELFGIYIKRVVNVK